MAVPSHCVIGVDVGGTYTDAVILRGREVLASCKCLTTRNRTDGIVNAIKGAFDSQLSGDARDIKSQISRVCIGTTHFINAVVERSTDKLSPVAVVRLCGPASVAVPPFSDFPMDLAKIVKASVHMIDGGVEYNGAPIGNVSADEIKKLANEFLSRTPPVTNVVVSSIFSPLASPDSNQEVQASNIFLEVSDKFSITLAGKIGKLGIIERENAAILNETLKVFAKYTISEFKTALESLQLRCPFYLTQNDGTLINVDEAIEYPVFTFSSGSTNSMRGAMFLSGREDGIVVDIGGTTTDVGVLVKGFPSEASSQVKVGGVRTNFRMPNVVSIGLGGGSLVNVREDNADNVSVGPNSVGLELTTKALCFGGDTCTATDIAIGAGICKGDMLPIENKDVILAKFGSVIYTAMRNIQLMIEEAIDLVKTSKDDCLVLLVGGGSVLVDTKVSLKGASRVIIPPHFEVANAVGAALGTIAGYSDSVESLSDVIESIQSGEAVERSHEDIQQEARKLIVEKCVNKALQNARQKGCLPGSEYVHEKSVMNVTYVPDALSVSVKVIGYLENQQCIGKEELPDQEKRTVASTEYPSDNSSLWPYQSVLDIDLDKEANLPLPQIDAKTGEWVLNELDVECITVGAGILGCGGGGDPNLGRVIATQFMRQGKKIRILNPLNINAEECGLLAAVAFMGAPVILTEKLVGGNENIHSLNTMQRILASGLCKENCNFGKMGKSGILISQQNIENGNDVWVVDPSTLPECSCGDPSIQLADKITGLISAEVGGANSIEPLIIGARVGLPVLDADGMGRAFPELQMFVPFINGLSPFPCCVADEKGNLVAISHISTAKDLENVLRVECIKMGMSCGICLPPMSLPDVLDKCVLQSYSRAWQIGRCVMRAKQSHSNVIQAIIRQQHGLLLITGKIVDVNRVTQDAFTGSLVTVKGTGSYSAFTIQISAKNENIIARELHDDDSIGQVLAMTPDLITVVDCDTGYPITTEDIKYGLRVSVLVLPADSKLLTEKALAVVGPKGFQMDEIEYRQPKTLL